MILLAWCAGVCVGAETLQLDAMLTNATTLVVGWQSAPTVAYEVQVSTNLATWVHAGAVTAATVRVTFALPVEPGGFQFLRVREASVDSDRDGLPDPWETQWFGDLASGPTDDPDEDGVENVGEWQAQTNPKSSDTDQDGMPDGWELTHALDPVQDDRWEDADRDRYPNTYEHSHGTLPADPRSQPTPDYRVGPAEAYRSLAAALAAASAGAVTHPIILIRPGVYSGATNRNLMIARNNPLLLAEGGMGSVTNDLQGQARAFTISTNCVLDGVLFVNGTASTREGGALWVGSGAVRVVDCVFRANTVGDDGGAVMLVGGDVVFRGCRFEGNVATDRGGAAYVLAANVRFQRCVFWQNWSARGGALFAYGGNTSLENCLLRANTAKTAGAAVFRDDTSLTLKLSHCTLVDHRPEAASTELSTLALDTRQAAAELRNSIFWNPATTAEFLGKGTTNVTYSIVRGGAAGVGNREIDPRLRLDGRLRATSPARDAAQPDDPVREDLDGEPRPFAAVADIGADEFVDGDGDGLADAWEQLEFAGTFAETGTTDPDFDGVPNAEEYDRELSPHQWNGALDLRIGPNRVDMLDSARTITFELMAFQPHELQIDVYSFGYDLTATQPQSLASPRFTRLGQLRRAVVAGTNRLSWDGVLPDTGEFHTADVLAFDVSSHRTLGGADTWPVFSAREGFVAAVTDAKALVSYKWGSKNWDNAGGVEQYRNQSGRFVVTDPSDLPSFVHNPYHRTLLSSRVMVRELVIDDWIPMNDDGESLYGQTYRPTSIVRGSTPAGAVAWLNQYARVTHFSVEAYAATPAHAEVCHARFDLTRAARVTLEFYTPSLWQHPLLFRTPKGDYQEARDLDLAAGSYDFEFAPVHHENNRARLFAEKHLLHRARASLDGYCRVKITATDPRTGRADVRWAYVRVNY